MILMSSLIFSSSYGKNKKILSCQLVHWSVWGHYMKQASVALHLLFFNIQSLVCSFFLFNIAAESEASITPSPSTAQADHRSAQADTLPTAPLVSQCLNQCQYQLHDAVIGNASRLIGYKIIHKVNVLLKVSFLTSWRKQVKKMCFIRVYYFVQGKQHSVCDIYVYYS